MCGAPSSPLGWTAFGGPASHLGYFRAEFVSRRKWLSDSAYADLVAMSQFLPGPASSEAAAGSGLRAVPARLAWGCVAAFFLLLGGLAVGRSLATPTSSPAPMPSTNPAPWSGVARKSWTRSGAT